MSEKKDVVTFPENNAYLERINAAKAGAPPVGGAPMPKNIPRLDSPPGDPYAGVQQPNPAGLLTQQQRQELEQRGALIPGVGSGYAANQPALRQKQQQGDQNWQNPPRPEGAGLRPETVQQLQEVAKANTEQPQEKSVKEDDAAAAERMKKEIEEYDDMDLDEFGNPINTLTQNKARREAIEARCKPLSLEDLMKYQELRQRVPIIPNSFEPTFRSTGAHEELYIKRRMGQERGSDAYMRDKFAMMGLTLGLYALNDTVLPNHLDKDGNVTDELFDKKLNILLRYPFDLIADLSVNYGWFGKRVRRLTVEQIKGF